MIDSMFQRGTDQALDDRVQRPRPAPPEDPSFSFGDLGAAPFRGVAGGSTTSAAFAADVAGAFGSVAGATGAFNAGGMFSTPTEEERRQQDEARKKLLTEGPQWSNEAGDLLRQRAREVLPDPATTHASAQVVAGLASFATQAVGYAAAGGPVVGSLLLGADAGLAEADKLRQQGVDLGTRAAAGAVAGAVAGASVALPVAGRTLAQTAGLVAVGGPGGFIAQNAAERAILANAGYEKQAAQYDPLDPVGLALATLVPAAFGGVALRARGARPATAPALVDVVRSLESGGRETDAAGNVLTSPKGAKGSMQVMDGTNRDPGFGVRPAADDSPAERARVGRDYIAAMVNRYGREDQALAAYNAGPGAVDAAIKAGGENWLARLPQETQTYVTRGMEMRGGEVVRGAVAADPDLVAAARVRQVEQSLDSLRLTSDADMPGRTAHIDALETAHAQLARGEPVAVTDILNMGSVREAFLLDEQIAAAEGLRAQALADAGNLADRGAIAPLRAELDRLQAERPDDSAGAVKSRAQELQQSEQLSYKQATKAAQREIELQVQQHDAQIQRLQGQLDTQARAQQATEALGRIDQGLETLRGRRAAIDAPVASPRRLAMALADAFREVPQPRRAAPAASAEPAPARATNADAPLSAPRNMGTDAAARPSESPGAGRAADMPPESAVAADRAAAEAPDMLVQLDGKEKMRAADLLEQVRQEAAEEAQDAQLVNVAANCFLRTA